MSNPWELQGFSPNPGTGNSPSFYDPTKFSPVATGVPSPVPGGTGQNETSNQGSQPPSYGQYSPAAVNQPDQADQSNPTWNGQQQQQYANGPVQQYNYDQDTAAQGNVIPAGVNQNMEASEQWKNNQSYNPSQNAEGDAYSNAMGDVYANQGYGANYDGMPAQDYQTGYYPEGGYGYQNYGNQQQYDYSGNYQQYGHAQQGGWQFNSGGGDYSTNRDVPTTSVMGSESFEATNTATPPQQQEQLYSEQSNPNQYLGAPNDMSMLRSGEISNASLQTMNYSREQSASELAPSVSPHSNVEQVTQQFENVSLQEGLEHYSNNDDVPVLNTGEQNYGAPSLPNQAVGGTSHDPVAQLRQESSHSRNNSLGVNFIVGSGPNSGDNSRSDSRTQVAGEGLDDSLPGGMDLVNSSTSADVVPNFNADILDNSYDQQQLLQPAVTNSQLRPDIVQFQTAADYGMFSPEQDVALSGLYLQERPPSSHSNVSGLSNERPGSTPRQRPPSAQSAHSNVSFEQHASARPLSAHSNASVERPPSGFQQTLQERPPSSHSVHSTTSGSERPGSSSSASHPPQQAGANWPLPVSSEDHPGLMPMSQNVPPEPLPPGGPDATHSWSAGSSQYIGSPGMQPPGPSSDLTGTATGIDVNATAGASQHPGQPDLLRASHHQAEGPPVTHQQPADIIQQGSQPQLGVGSLDIPGNAAAVPQMPNRDHASPEHALNIFSTPIEPRRESAFQPPHRHGGSPQPAPENVPRGLDLPPHRDVTPHQAQGHIHQTEGQVQNPVVSSHHAQNPQSTQIMGERNDVTAPGVDANQAKSLEYQTPPDLTQGGSLNGPQQSTPRKSSVDHPRANDNKSPATALWENPEPPKIPMFLAPVSNAPPMQPRPAEVVPLNVSDIQQALQREQMSQQQANFSQSNNSVTPEEEGRHREIRRVRDDRSERDDSSESGMSDRRGGSRRSNRDQGYRDDDRGVPSTGPNTPADSRRKENDPRYSDPRDNRDKDKHRSRDNDKRSRDDRDRRRKDDRDRDRYRRDDRDRPRSRQGDRERASSKDRERSDFDRSDRDRTDRNRSDRRDRPDRDRYDRDRYDRDRDRYDRDRYDRDRYDRDRNDRDRYDRDRYDRDRYDRNRSSDYDKYGGHDSRKYDQYGHYQSQLNYGYPTQDKYSKGYLDEMKIYYSQYYSDPRVAEYYAQQYVAQYYGQSGSRPSSRQGSLPSSRQGSRSNTPAIDSYSNSEHQRSSRPSSRQGYDDSYYSNSSMYDYGQGGYDNNQWNQTQEVIAAETTPGRITPPKHLLPHVRVTFGASGLVKTLPNRPAEGEPAVIELHDISYMMYDTSEVDELKAFPGPLVKGETHKSDVISFCQTKIRQCRDDLNMIDRESAELVWKFLTLLIKQNGTVVGSDISELLLEGHEHTTEEYDQQGLKIIPSMDNMAAIIQQQDGAHDDEEPHAEEKQLATTVNQTRLTPVVSTQDVTDKFRHLLLYGRKKDALEWAAKNNLWGHALFLASKMDARTHAQIMTKFANSAIKLNDPLQTLYQLMSGRQPAAVTGLSDTKWGDWRPHLAMILSNMSNNPVVDRRSIMALGDTLASKGYLHGAHFCYLMAQTSFGVYDKKSSKIVLIGSNHGLPFNQFASYEAMQRTEVFEYAQLLGNPLFSLVNFQCFKYLYATRLADNGLPVEALKYCEVLANTIAQMPGAYSEFLVKQVYELGQRLKYSDPQLLQVGDLYEDPAWLMQCKRILQAFEDGAIQPVSGTQTPMDFSGSGPGSEMGDTTRSFNASQPVDQYQGQQYPGYDQGQGQYQDWQQQQQQQQGDWSQQPQSAWTQQQANWNQQQSNWTQQQQDQYNQQQQQQQYGGGQYDQMDGQQVDHTQQQQGETQGQEQRRGSMLVPDGSQGMMTQVPPLDLNLMDSMNSQFTTNTVSSEDPDSPLSDSMASQDYYNMATKQTKKQKTKGIDLVVYPLNTEALAKEINKKPIPKKSPRDKKRKVAPLSKYKPPLPSTPAISRRSYHPSPLASSATSYRHHNYYLTSPSPRHRTQSTPNNQARNRHVSFSNDPDSSCTTPKYDPASSNTTPRSCLRKTTPSKSPIFPSSDGRCNESLKENTNQQGLCNASFLNSPCAPTQGVYRERAHASRSPSLSPIEPGIQQLQPSNCSFSSSLAVMGGNLMGLQTRNLDASQLSNTDESFFAATAPSIEDLVKQFARCTLEDGRELRSLGNMSLVNSSFGVDFEQRLDKLDDSLSKLMVCIRDLKLKDSQHASDISTTTRNSVSVATSISSGRFESSENEDPCEGGQKIEDFSIVAPSLISDDAIGSTVINAPSVVGQRLSNSHIAKRQFVETTSASPLSLKGDTATIVNQSKEKIVPPSVKDHCDGSVETALDEAHHAQLTNSSVMAGLVGKETLINSFVEKTVASNSLPGHHTDLSKKEERLPSSSVVGSTRSVTTDSNQTSVRCVEEHNDEVDRSIDKMVPTKDSNARCDSVRFNSVLSSRNSGVQLETMSNSEHVVSRNINSRDGHHQQIDSISEQMCQQTIEDNGSSKNILNGHLPLRESKPSEKIQTESELAGSYEQLSSKKLHHPGAPQVQFSSGNHISTLPPTKASLLMHTQSMSLGADGMSEEHKGKHPSVRSMVQSQQSHNRVSSLECTQNPLANPAKEHLGNDAENSIFNAGDMSNCEFLGVQCNPVVKSESQMSCNVDIDKPLRSAEYGESVLSPPTDILVCPSSSSESCIVVYESEDDASHPGLHTSSLSCNGQCDSSRSMGECSSANMTCSDQGRRSMTTVNTEPASKVNIINVEPGMTFSLKLNPMQRPNYKPKARQRLNYLPVDQTSRLALEATTQHYTSTHPHTEKPGGMACSFQQFNENTQLSEQFEPVTASSNKHYETKGNLEQSCHEDLSHQQKDTLGACIMVNQFSRPDEARLNNSRETLVAEVPVKHSSPDTTTSHCSVHWESASNTTPYFNQVYQTSDNQSYKQDNFYDNLTPTAKAAKSCESDCSSSASRLVEKFAAESPGRKTPIAFGSSETMDDFHGTRCYTSSTSLQTDSEVPVSASTSGSSINRQKLSSDSCNDLDYCYNPIAGLFIDKHHHADKVSTDNCQLEASGSDRSSVRFATCLTLENEEGFAKTVSGAMDNDSWKTTSSSSTKMKTAAPYSYSLLPMDYGNSLMQHNGHLSTVVTKDVSSTESTNGGLHVNYHNTQLDSCLNAQHCGKREEVWNVDSRKSYTEFNTTFDDDGHGRSVYHSVSSVVRSSETGGSNGIVQEVYNNSLCECSDGNGKMWEVDLSESCPDVARDVNVVQSSSSLELGNSGESIRREMEDIRSMLQNSVQTVERQTSNASSGGGSTSMAQPDSPNINPTRFTFQHQQQQQQQDQQVGPPLSVPNMAPPHMPPTGPSMSNSDKISPRMQQYGQFASSQSFQAKPGFAESRRNSGPVTAPPMGNRSRQTSGNAGYSDNTPKVSAASANKEAKKDNKQSGGWFGGLFNWRKGKNEMILPDDKNPTIVWDDKKKKWVNTSSDEPDEPPPPPPPKDMDMGGMNSAPSPMNAPPGGPTPAGPPADGTSRYSLKARGTNKKYVDVFGSGKQASVQAPSSLFNVMPTSSPALPSNIFVPQPLPGGEPQETQPAVPQEDDVISRSSSLASFEVSQITQQGQNQQQYNHQQQYQTPQDTYAGNQQHMQPPQNAYANSQQQPPQAGPPQTQSSYPPIPTYQQQAPPPTQPQSAIPPVADSQPPVEQAPNSSGPMMFNPTQFTPNAYQAGPSAQKPRYGQRRQYPK